MVRHWVVLLIAVAVAVLAGAPGLGAAPQDERIAFATNRADNLWRNAYYSVLPNGRRRRLVVRPTVHAATITRSRDGSRILFSRTGDQLALYVARPSGADAVQVTPRAFGFDPLSVATISPDGRRVAFTRDEGSCGQRCIRLDLYVVNADGTGLQHVATGASQHSWAPDGRRLVYARGLYLPNRVWVYDVETGTRRRIANGWMPVWSPRGNRIVYRGGPGRFHRLPCFVNADGSGRRCLRSRGWNPIRFVWSGDAKRVAFNDYVGGRPRIATVAAAGRTLRYLPLTGQWRPLAWSPDNRQLALGGASASPTLAIVVANVNGRGRAALVTHRQGSRTLGLQDVRWERGRLSYAASLWDSDYEIATMRPDGSDVRLLTDSDANERDPEWSPDGRSIAFARLSGDSDVRGVICVMGRDGSDEFCLPQQQGPTQDRWPAWSPDGRRIAFVRLFPGFQANLMIMSVDGSGLRSLRHVPGRPGQITWTPDSRSVVSGGARDLRIINAETGTEQLLWTRSGWAGSPAWSPDGEWVLFTSSWASAPPELERFDLFRFRPADSALGPIAEDIAPDSQGGSWSGDGSHVVFARRGAEVRYRTWTSALFAVRADGTGETQLTHDFSANLDPASSRG